MALRAARSRSAPVLASLAVVLLALGACRSSAPRVGEADAGAIDLSGYRPGPSTPALPSALVAQYADMGLIPHETRRFEFSRRDSELGLVRRRPILATNQWPQPARPLEDPVRFHRWRQ